MQSFTGQWLKPKIFDGYTFPYQGENEKDSLWMRLHRKEMTRLMPVLRSEKPFQHKAVQRQFP